MPRRNFWLLATLTVLCLACSIRARRSAQIFSYALGQIERFALEPVAERELLQGALDGLMGELKDKHSSYLRPTGAEELQQTLEQKFDGVGLQVILDPTTKQLTVASPMYGAPAYQAGVRTGDKILRIDGRSTQGLSLDDSVAMMKGKPGTAVLLTVKHEGEAQPVEIRVVRGAVRVDSVLGDTRNPDGSWNYILEGSKGIAYVRINLFASQTAEELDEVLHRLVAQKVRGLVLDLRDNPGGMVEAALAICKMFIHPGLIISTRNRDGSVRGVFLSKEDGKYLDFPIAVLVNGQSASASEIVAACLQDHTRAVVVGQRTYGKGTVQELLDLPGGEGKLRITAASFWRPSGKNINRAAKAGERDEWGVSPDPGYDVKLQGEELARVVRWRHDRDVSPAAKPGAVESKSSAARLPTELDPQLAKAVQYIESYQGPRM